MSIRRAPCTRAQRLPEPFHIATVGDVEGRQLRPELPLFFFSSVRRS